MGKPWFAPKTFGYGSGLPIAWQGWVMLAVHLLAIAGAIYLARTHFGHRPPLVIAVALAISLAPAPLYAAKTQGGWHWRSGGQ